MEENEAVRMSYCELGNGWVDGGERGDLNVLREIYGWVGGWDVPGQPIAGRRAGPCRVRQ